MYGLSDDLIALGRELVRWEAQLNPFGCPDPYFFEGARGEPEPLPKAYLPDPYEVMDTARELLPRPRARLSARDATLLHACLARAPFEPTPADKGLLPGACLRSPYTSLPLDQAAAEHGRGRRRDHEERLRAHRYWVRADVTNLTGTLDRGLLLQSLHLPAETAGTLRKLLEHLGLGPRRGIRTCGRATHLLARAYLDPVVRGLQGYEFLHTDLDEFHFYVDTRARAGRVLDHLTRLLEPLALHLNYQKTFVISATRARAQELQARFDPRFLRHRVAAAAAASVHPWVVRTLTEPLYSEAFLHRKPGYRELLKTPAGRAAFQQRLTDPTILPGDRTRLELFQSHA